MELCEILGFTRQDEFWNFHLSIFLWTRSRFFQFDLNGLKHYSNNISHIISFKAVFTFCEISSDFTYWTVLNGILNDIYWYLMIFKLDFLAWMILKWDFLVYWYFNEMTHLESFQFNNITHFHHERRKSNWYSARCELHRDFLYLCSAQFSRAERVKISISPMPDSGYLLNGRPYKEFVLLVLHR